MKVTVDLDRDQELVKEELLSKAFAISHILSKWLVDIRWRPGVEIIKIGWGHSYGYLCANILVVFAPPDLNLFQETLGGKFRVTAKWCIPKDQVEGFYEIEGEKEQKERILYIRPLPNQNPVSIAKAVVRVLQDAIQDRQGRLRSAVSQLEHNGETLAGLVREKVTA